MTDDVSRDEMIQGFLYAHTRSNLNTIETHRAQADVLALLEVLIARGLVDRKEYEEQRAAINDRLQQEFVGKGMAVAIENPEYSKYEHSETFTIDCENRISLCKAACCRLAFALSKEDVEEGVVKWDLGRPYIIAHNSDGYCTHINKDSKACGVYNKRPMTCRNYDCRKDDRIWVDFDKRIVNPRVGDADWPKSTQLQKEPE